MDWTFGLLIVPGVFFGAMAGTHLTRKLSSQGLRRAVTMLFGIGVWEALAVRGKSEIGVANTDC